MVLAFTYQALPMRVVLGPGALAGLGDELGRLGLRRLLVLCSPEQDDTGHRVAEGLGGLAAGVFAQARMHVPVEVAERAGEQAVRLGADGCVAVGGGSAIGLGKAVALARGLPV
ncbi:iron-containing alcohol dehydrogenase, partial [Pseudonocardia kujensis]|uniref:iron-containing alcohol dehydrogenase n=1 Tax=Pseudonocardia kujensis TaxID=1128675 RepID=UPI001E36252C